MKHDFSQGDFSSGELPPGMHGSIDSEAYKTGVRRAVNMLPSRTHSMASRAGGGWLADGFNAQTGLLDNSPVQHIPVLDSQFGDFIIEISQHTMRFLDGYGIRDWNLYQNGALLQYTVQDGMNAWGDSTTRTVYLSNPSGIGGKSYVLSLGEFGIGALIKNGLLAGFPAGTNGDWTISGRIAGDAVTLEVRNDLGALIHTSPALAGSAGIFSYTFAGGATDFSLTLKSAVGVVCATSLWDIKLTKNATTTALNLAGVGAPTLPLGVERVRAVSFWTSADKPYKGDPAVFWVVFAGGPRNAWAGWCLKWTLTNGGVWSFIALPTDNDSFALIAGSTDVAVYQDRLWFLNNKAAGRPQLIGSCIGFMRAFDAELFGGVVGAEAAKFVFKVLKYNYTVVGAVAGFAHNQEGLKVVNDPAGGPSPGSLRAIRFDFSGSSNLVTPAQLLASAAIGLFGEAPNVSVKVNGIPVKVTPAPANFISAKMPAVPFSTGSPAVDLGRECWAAYPGTVDVNGGLGLHQSAFAGEVYFTIAAGWADVGDVIEFSTVPLADDPLNLTLASPTGIGAWLAVLRGLLLGSTTNEKLFSQDTPLTIDPATGQSFSADDESSLGSDPALPAVAVGDKIVFVQKGRQVLRQASISITTNGGLVSEDVGVLGEHLTRKRIRTFCFLKSPTQRLVLGFDDGTAAVMTLREGKLAAWSRLTIPAAYGGVYSVAALDSAGGSELFVGTENGVALHWSTLDSDVLAQEVVVPGVPPAAPVHKSMDPETPRPAVMDGWQRCAMSNGSQALGLSKSLAGHQVYAFFAGQLYGPYLVVAGSGADGSDAVTFPADFGFGATWMDQAGARRPSEVYVGLTYPEHRFVSLPLESGNPTGTSQTRTSRKVQLYVRFVDSYLPLVNGTRPEERDPDDSMDALPSRVGVDAPLDVRCTEMEFTRGAVVDIQMDLPLRVEVAGLFGGTQVNIL